MKASFYIFYSIEAKTSVTINQLIRYGNLVSKLIESPNDSNKWCPGKRSHVIASCRLVVTGIYYFQITQHLFKIMGSFQTRNLLPAGGKIGSEFQL